MKRLALALIAAAGASVSPPSVAVVSFVAGSSLAVAGVYQLAGPGWALIAGSVPLLLLSVVLIRGLTRG